MFDGTITKINADIVLHEPSGGIRFGTDALLLAHFAAPAVKKGKCLDLGTGSGVLPLLLLALESTARFTGLEYQQNYAEIASLNSKENGFQDRFEVICGDAANYKNLFQSGSFDYVVTNPPYMRADCGKSNDSQPLAIARREICGGAEVFCRCASWCLKSGGRFFAVYRPDRLVHLLCAMRENSIEPKRLRAVVASPGMAPSLILVEGRKDGREGLVYMPDLYIYSDSTHTTESDEYIEIYKGFSK